MLTQEEVKSLSHQDLIAILDGFTFRTPMMLHQAASVLWALARKNAMCVLGIGGGKTLTSLYITQVWQCKRILVVCPPSVRYAWKEQVQQHTFRSFVDLDGTASERRELTAKSNAELHILNYQGLRVLYGKKTTVLEDGKQVNRIVVDADAIERAAYDCVIFDECHKLKDITALQTQIAYKLARTIPKIIMLSGTPVGNSIADLWAEFKVLDNGATLGPVQFEFLHKYFKRVEIKLKRGRFWDWQPLPDAAEKVAKLCAMSSIRFDVRECVDLPEVTYERRYVQPSTEQRRLMAGIAENLRMQLAQGQLRADEAINKASKLAQIAGGFVIGDAGVSHLADNPKLDELLALMQEIEGKVIIFHVYVEEARLIEKAFTAAGIKYSSLRGEIKNKDKQLDAFIKNPAVKAIIAHPLSGGEGLNLQVAEAIVFYSQLHSGAITREQCEGRIVRTGQKAKHVTIVDLLLHDASSAKESIDEHIYKSARNQRNLADAILEWIQSE